MLFGVPRQARVVVAAAPHHVTQRGNNRQQTFFTDAQRRRYLALLGQYSRLHELRILGYCLMPNHVHLIVVPEREDALAKGVGRADNAYSRYLNKLRGRSGHLWQNRFWSMPMEGDHLLPALRYVDLNPVRARLVERAEQYEWSSARAHATGQDPAGLVDFELWRRVAPLEDWAGVLAETPEGEEQWQQRFRAATYAGKPLGSKEFVKKLEEQAGRNLEQRGRGRPRKRRKARTATAGGRS